MKWVRVMKKNVARGFKPETIAKVIHIAKEVRNHYDSIPVDDIAMCISSGNRKIGKVMNVSLMPIMTCGNCKECKHFCYDIKACFQYPGTVIDARIRNTSILFRNREEYFARIEKKISHRKANKFFRWHVAGDIIDSDYFDRMVSIAIAHPDFVFWTYTKMYVIVNDWIASHGALPTNLHVMFSEWDGIELDNPYNMPIFTCKMPGGNINHDDSFFNGLFKCPGNCDICKRDCRGCIAGESTYNDLH